MKLKKQNGIEIIDSLPAKEFENYFDFICDMVKDLDLPEQNAFFNKEFVEDDRNIFKNVPKSNGSWTGTVGDSKWVPDKKYVPKKFNKSKKTWKEILDTYGIDGNTN